MSEAGVKSECLVNFVDSYSRFEIFSNSFFKEVGFALEANFLHPFERVVGVVVSVAAKVY